MKNSNRTISAVIGIVVGVLVTSGVCWVRCSSSDLAIKKLPINMKLLEGKDNIVPIAIIGSGPAGLSAGLYGARSGIDTVVLEGNKPGGLLTETTEVENWPGDISIKGPDIVAKQKKQAQHQGAYFLSDAVSELSMDRWPFVLHTQDGKELHALSVVIATGANPRRLGVPGEDEYWGGGVTSCAVCDAPFFKGEDVVVVGGGDSAVEEAIQLSSYARSITVLVRKDAMRAAASMQKRLEGYPNISVRYNVEVKKINGDGNKVQSVELFNNKDASTVNLPIAGVFLAIGHDPSTSLFKDVVALDQAGHVKLVGRSQQTSLLGVFAAGDVEDHVYRQAGVASGSGIKAALDAVNFLSEIGYDKKTADELSDKIFRPQGAATGTSAVPLVNDLTLFEEHMQGEKEIMVVDFYTYECPTCLQMMPSFEAVAEQFADRGVFIKVDAGEADEIVKKYFVHKVPCLLVFKKGELVARFNNVMTKKELISFVEQFIQ